MNVSKIETAILRDFTQSPMQFHANIDPINNESNRVMKHTLQWNGESIGFCLVLINSKGNKNVGTQEEGETRAYVRAEESS